MVQIFPAKDFSETMDSVITPYVVARRKTGYYARVDGQPMYYEHISLTEEDVRSTGHRGTIVLVHGFSEGVRKFYETVWYFMHLGYDVWLYQQRGHGLSYHETKIPSLVHIGDYRSLIADLHAFVEHVVRPASNGAGNAVQPVSNGEENAVRTASKGAGNVAQPTSNAAEEAKGSEWARKLILFAHSMGGAVGADLIEHYPDDFDKAILTSPMLQLDSGSTPVWQAELAARLLILLGKGGNFMPGAHGWEGKPDFEGSCTNCRERYDYWFREQCAHPENQMTGASVKTSLEFLKLTRDIAKPDNCAAVKIPVLLFQAEKDGTVLPGGQNHFIECIGEHGRLCVMRDAKHEIYRNTDDILAVYWKEIEQFLEA